MMDFNQNNYKCFKFNFDFGKGQQQDMKGQSQSFKESFAELKRKIKDRDSNRKGKNPLLIIFAALVIMFIIFFLTLPALNYMAPEFYSFLITAVIVYNVLNLVFGKMSILRTGTISVAMIAILVIAPIVLGFLSQPIFSAKSYSRLILVEDAN